MSSDNRTTPARKALSAGPVTLVLELPPFSTLTAKQGREIIAHLRFPNDPQRQRELLSGKSLTLSSNEWYVLIRADQLLASLDRLERMEKHYFNVAKLDASEVRGGLEASDPDDLGALAYKWCLTNDGADPRLQIAKRILALIPARAGV